ncbi:hypothetical protein T439DRAFT_344541 [Meredithblackwellia eburnea MCA 4105]
MSSRTTTATIEPRSKKTKIISGDALDDDFELDASFLPSDDDEQGAIALTGADDDDELPSGVLSDSEVEVGNDNIPGGVVVGDAKKKRKREEKERKKRAAKKARVEEDEAAGPDSLALLPSEILADRMAEKQTKALPGLSALEKDDLRLVESMFQDTSSISDRKSLYEFIKTALPTLPATLAKPPKKMGSPRVIVVAGAALRVADLCREVKPFKTKDIDVGKLFAKHFKLAEHVTYLEKNKVGIAVGTPNRIGKLLSETESLNLTHLSHLMLDVTHLDAKKRNLLDMPECREDLFKLVLGNKGLMERLRMGRMKVVLY